MQIPLEDQAQDIIGKARRGLKMSASQFAQKAGLSLEQLERLQGGHFNASDARILAKALALDAESLVGIGLNTWRPEAGPLPATFAPFNSSFEDMTVNAYLVWEHPGGSAIAFDTGGNCAAMLKTLRTHQLTLESVFLTHTHYDHLAALDELLAEAPGAKVYVSEHEKLARATGIHDGQQFESGGLRITARLTPGHSAGGLTYVIDGLERQIAIVGDALFAGSMGGVGPESYAGALRANEANILSLPDATLICPVHGPLTTVAEEKGHNPFYARESD